MTPIRYIHWQDGDAWLGYLEEYPDYWTQGETLDDLIEHLKDLSDEFLHVDPANGCVIPNPAHPDQPVLKVK